MDRAITLLVLVKLALFASVATYALGEAPVPGPGLDGPAVEEPAPEPPGPVHRTDALADADLLDADQL